MYDGKPLDEVPDGAVGFVYLIQDASTGKSYIGKKNFYQSRLKKNCGSKRKTRVTTESNWRSYISSCRPLQGEIKSRGKDQFSFFILRLCKTTRELTYCEQEEQFRRDVLRATLSDGSPAFYNDSIGGRFFRGFDK